MPAALSFCLVLGLEAHRLVGRDQGDVGGKAADEQGLGDAVAVAADHADFLVGDLKAVADRAIADQAAGQRVVVQCLVHRRAAVADPGGEQHARAVAEPEPHSAVNRPLSSSRSSLVTNSVSIFGAIFAGLVPHALEQVLAADAVGKAGMVVGAGNRAARLLPPSTTKMSMWKRAR